MSRVLLALLFFPSLAFADTRYLVEFRGTPSKAQFERFRRDATVALGKRGVDAVKPRHELSRVFHGVAVTLDDAAAGAVRQLPYVAALHEDREMQLFGTDVTHLERIGAKQVWTSLGARGDGVDRTHPAFAGRYAGGWDFIELDEEPQDPSASLFWTCGSDFQGRPMLYRDPRTLLPLRTCSAIVQIQAFGGEPPAVILDERTIRADETIAFTPAQAPYRLTLGGVDEQGRPLHAQDGYTSLQRIDFGASRSPRYLYFPQAPRLSAMPDDVTVRVTEVVADLANERVVGVQHAPLRGVHGDHTFVNASTELTKTRVTLLPSVGELFVAPMDGDRAFGTIVAHASMANGWAGDVWVTPWTAPSSDGLSKRRTSRH